LRGKSRSLVNDDIPGAKPKQFGGTSTSHIVNDFAGISSGMQQRLKEINVPWGVGGNLDATSYGKKWMPKPSSKYDYIF
jgi:hypothetical protein